MRFAIVLLIALAAWSFPACADDSADWQTCDGNSSPSSINACTRIILRGESSVSDLAVAYSNRGLSRAKNGNNDIALADIEQAIHLNPPLTTIVVWPTRTKAITTAPSPISAWPSASILNWSSPTTIAAMPIG